MIFLELITHTVCLFILFYIIYGAAKDKLEDLQKEVAFLERKINSLDEAVLGLEDYKHRSKAEIKELLRHVIDLKKKDPTTKETTPSPEQPSL